MEHEKNEVLGQGLSRDEYRELQDRVGERLTQGLSDWTLDEFGLFMDKNVKGMRRWLLVYCPGYQDDPRYLTLLEAGMDEGEALCAYGSLAWLDVNCPGYADVVNEELRRILDERELIGQVFGQEPRA